MNIGIVLGTRPEVMKNYAIVQALRAADLPFVVLHTNQHHDHLLQTAIFGQMGYMPDEVFPGNYSIGAAIDWVREQIRRHDIDLILVNGDTAAALVGAIAAVYSDVGLAHVEAGLRAFDKRMYEERNRIMVDGAAHYLFSYTQYQADYLAKIPDLRGRIFNIGNTTVDLIHDFAHELTPRRNDTYAYITLHRKEFTDSRELMQQVFSTINELAQEFDAMIFPMHPRTRAAMEHYGLSMDLLSRVQVLDPVEPFESLAYEKYANIIITDSGCIQEEAYIFGVPCVTVRENTERPETIDSGANVVTGFEPTAIIAAVRNQRAKKGQQFSPVYGERGVGQRIVATLQAHFRSWSDY
ncbi:MAG TPA: UDP-N-acetylglucosamine 2-epimerase (non-hydrolyzing) [Herpetosiphon sp.]|uniref:UDP-N-acetylglucosamine 2-epimerase n=1 Tax=Herpetosiphon aurantiacus (strain ATCC 23779 / DSM 785 / 114-95) TaxID=316274 RepID=A9B0D2_HERA2|nr:UDP-N-acetylglucosamine 2-epimerase (non-hydrolyzing) [Herpetosiphon sp.]ABX05241.1 UDP-N-acetylglucosamine 2-epimerase [Herpetosiphon aurantiacus DSM 785]HBW51249.1 UDP-N-acetylglucosamine 2-epimerase (non-hydrolyzing) [Herpetosiphon sp.]